MTAEKEVVNNLEKNREQGLDRSHTQGNHAPAERSPAERHNVNRSQTVRRDGRGRPVEDDEEIETPLTDEAMAKVGDPEMGRWTPGELAEQDRPRAIGSRDRRAYLVDQALKNEAVNDEVNEREVALANEGRERGVRALDPDQMRESSLESAVADINLHTKEGAEKRSQLRQQMAEERAERGDPSPVPGDTSGGHGGADRPENKGTPDKGNTKDKDAKK